MDSTSTFCKAMVRYCLLFISLPIDFHADTKFWEYFYQFSYVSLRLKDCGVAIYRLLQVQLTVRPLGCIRVQQVVDHILQLNQLRIGLSYVLKGSLKVPNICFTILPQVCLVMWLFSKTFCASYTSISFYLHACNECPSSQQGYKKTDKVS